MPKFLKNIKSEVRTHILAGEEPQMVYEHVCEKYHENEKDKRFLKKYIAAKVKDTVTPTNRTKFGFLYYLYLISLWIAFLVTIISKQHRIDALGIGSLSSVSAITGFVVFNLFAWIYLYLSVRSLRFNLSMAYQALIIAVVDVVRLAVLFPVYWIETPYFAVLRIIPPLLVIILGAFYVLYCSNPFFKNKNGEIEFKVKKIIHFGQQ